MITRKLQIVTPIVTSVNGQTGEITMPVDDSLNATSENPIQNKAVNGAISDINNSISEFATDVSTQLGEKVNKINGKGLSTNDYTAAAKAKVDAIPASPKYTDTVYDDTALSNRVGDAENKLNGSGSVTFANITTTGLTTKGEIEIYGAQPHLDFHFANASDDYTSRIIETESGKINILAPNGLMLNGANLKYDDTAVKNRLTAVESADAAMKKRLDAIENSENVALTVATDTNKVDRLTGLTYTAKYIPMLGMVFVRIYGKVNTTMNIGYDYNVLNIGSRKPNANAALAVKCGKNAQVIAQTSGVISVRPFETGIKGYDIYIAGFWFV